MINIFNISYKGTIKEVMDYLKGINLCKECNGKNFLTDNIGYCGGCEFCGSREEVNVMCENCYGTGKEEDEQIINERIWCA